MLNPLEERDVLEAMGVDKDVPVINTLSDG